MQSFCFCSLNMQNLWCCRCRRVVDLKLPIRVQWTLENSNNYEHLTNTNLISRHVLIISSKHFIKSSLCSNTVDTILFWKFHLVCTDRRILLATQSSRHDTYLISTGSCCASWVENSAPIPLLKIHAQIKWCPIVYSVLTTYFAFDGVLGFYVGFMIIARDKRSHGIL